MESINARILSYLLDIKQEDANKKISVILERINGNTDMVLRIPEEGLSIETEVYEKYTGQPISKMIESIRKNYLKNTATRSYILDYPEAKLVPAKKTGQFPKTVSIPPALRALLTPDQRDEIIEQWNKKYANHQAVLKFGTVFKC